MQRRLKAHLLLLVGLCLLACSGLSPQPSDASLTGEELSGEETVTLKVLSFNLLYGAGVDRRFDANIPLRFRDRDRLAELMAFLKEAGPDILSLQEAGGWESGIPSVADQVAASLGMRYVIARDPWDLNVVLFSKYPIIEADYVSRAQGFNGVILRAMLAVTPTAQVNVFAAHLYSMSPQTRACQVEALLDMAGSFSESRSLIVGDMNFRPESGQGQQLTASGWRLIAVQDYWRIDQIWVDPAANGSVGDWWGGLTPPRDVSDHLPIGADVTLSLPRKVIRAARTGPPVEPRALQYACAIPTPRPAA